VSNCVFSAGFPSSYASNAGGNTWSTVTVSYWIFALSTYGCSGVPSPLTTPLQSPTLPVATTYLSPFPSESRLFPNSDLFSPSFVRFRSDPLTFSVNVIPSSQFVPCSHFQHTIALSLSGIFTPSIRFNGDITSTSPADSQPSKYFQETKSLWLSQGFSPSRIFTPSGTLSYSQQLAYFISTEPNSASSGTIQIHSNSLNSDAARTVAIFSSESNSVASETLTFISTALDSFFSQSLPAFSPVLHSNVSETVATYFAVSHESTGSTVLMPSPVSIASPFSGSIATTVSFSPLRSFSHSRRSTSHLIPLPTPISHVTGSLLESSSVFTPSHIRDLNAGAGPVGSDSTGLFVGVFLSVFAFIGLLIGIVLQKKDPESRAHRI
jgi:hypothetical protein